MHIVPIINGDRCCVITLMFCIKLCVKDLTSFKVGVVHLLIRKALNLSFSDNLKKKRELCFHIHDCIQ